MISSGSRCQQGDSLTRGYANDWSILAEKNSIAEGTLRERYVEWLDRLVDLFLPILDKLAVRSPIYIEPIPPANDDPDSRDRVVKCANGHIGLV
jgi:hypothetical protein